MEDAPPGIRLPGLAKPRRRRSHSRSRSGLSNITSASNQRVRRFLTDYRKETILQAKNLSASGSNVDSGDEKSLPVPTIPALVQSPVHMLVCTTLQGEPPVKASPQRIYQHVMHAAEGEHASDFQKPPASANGLKYSDNRVWRDLMGAAGQSSSDKHQLSSRDKKMDQEMSTRVNGLLNRITEVIDQRAARFDLYSSTTLTETGFISARGNAVNLLRSARKTENSRKLGTLRCVSHRDEIEARKYSYFRLVLPAGTVQVKVIVEVTGGSVRLMHSWRNTYPVLGERHTEVVGSGFVSKQAQFVLNSSDLRGHVGSASSDDTPSPKRRELTPLYCAVFAQSKLSIAVKHQISTAKPNASSNNSIGSPQPWTSPRRTLIARSTRNPTQSPRRLQYTGVLEEPDSDGGAPRSPAHSPTRRSQAAATPKVKRSRRQLQHLLDARVRDFKNDKASVQRLRDRVSAIRRHQRVLLQKSMHSIKEDLASLPAPLPTENDGDKSDEEASTNATPDNFAPAPVKQRRIEHKLSGPNTKAFYIRRKRRQISRNLMLPPNALGRSRRSKSLTEKYQHWWLDPTVRLNHSPKNSEQGVSEGAMARSAYLRRIPPLHRNLDCQQHLPEQIHSRRSAWHQQHNARIERARRRASDRLMNNYEVTIRRIDERNARREEKVRERERERRNAVLQSRSQKWRTLLCHAMYFGSMRELLDKLRRHALKRAIQEDAALVLQFWMRKWMDRKRQERAKFYFHAFRSAMLLSAFNYHVIKKDRAANILQQFLEQISGVKSIARIVKNYRSRVTAAQSAIRSMLAVKRHRLDRWRLQVQRHFERLVRDGEEDASRWRNIPEWALQRALLDTYHEKQVHVRDKELPEWRERMAEFRERHKVARAKQHTPMQRQKKRRQRRSRGVSIHEERDVDLESRSGHILPTLLMLLPRKPHVPNDVTVEEAVSIVGLAEQEFVECDDDDELRPTELEKVRAKVAAARALGLDWKSIQQAEERRMRAAEMKVQQEEEYEEE